jgi:hypothetical protein
MGGADDHHPGFIDWATYDANTPAAVELASRVVRRRPAGRNRVAQGRLRWQACRLMQTGYHLHEGNRPRYVRPAGSGLWLAASRAARYRGRRLEERVLEVFAVQLAALAATGSSTTDAERAHAATARRLSVERTATRPTAKPADAVEPRTGGRPHPERALETALRRAVK